MNDYATTLPPFEDDPRPIRVRLNGHDEGEAPAVDADTIVRWREDTWTEAALPKRPWIARGYLLRGHVTVVGGAGAAGKSMLILGYGVALALDIPWGRFKPENPCRVAILNAEDDDDEQRLRLSAVLRQHGRTPDDLVAKLARVSLPTGAKLVHYDAASGNATGTDAMTILEEHLERFKPDILALDPLIELHDAPENDNVAFAAACRVLRGLARTHRCAVILAHHVRKGSADAAGDPDIIRGGMSLVGMSRIALTVCVMTKAEADALNVDADNRRFYFRVDDAKGNYAPPSSAAWFERVEHELDNGESTAAAVPWQPPSDVVTLDHCLTLLDRIARAKEPLSPRLDKRPRSFRQACKDVGLTTLAAQNDVLERLQRDHGVTIGTWVPSRKGANDGRLGLRTAQGEPSSARWSDDVETAG